MLSLLLQYFSFALASPALAVHNEGLFELDGNATDSAAIEPDDDWNSLNHAIDSIFIPGSVEKDGADVTYFTGGGSKDVNDISQWNYSSNDVAPDKDEILDAFAAAYEKNGDTFVYFGADRFDGSGDSFIGFWFLQNNIGLGANGSFNGVHKNGDILVLSDFTNGGSVAGIKIYEWLNGGLTLKESGAECDLPGPEEACATVNADTTNAPWAFLNKSGSNDFAAGEFYEGGVNLDTIFGGDAPCFSGFLAETRSSQSTTAQLKDFALGNLSTCVPPDMATDASVSTWHFGDAGVTDTATLTGTAAHGAPSGSVRFYICLPGEPLPCAGTAHPVGGAVAVNTSGSTGTATSIAYVPTAVGKYCFRAVYTPDAASDYLAASHTNETTECFTVVKNNTSITTSAEETVDISDTISDSAVLAGATSDAGGTITFRAYGPADENCDGTPAFTSSALPVSGNGTYGPVSFTPTTAGVYHWIATYSGDAKNEGSAGACLDDGENDTVNKVTPTITTQASAAVTVGGTITDTATVSGGNSPTGTIDFALYGPADPNCLAAPIFTSADRPMTGGSATSDAYTTTAVGTYHWIASYSGDANNNAVSGACGDANESVVVNPTTPSIVTSLVSGAKTGASIGVTIGSTVHDTSTLSGATADAGGTVHYQVFSDSTCATLEADAGTIAVVNGVPGDSNALVFNHAGTFYWQADYSGDAKNGSASSACNLETVTVAANAPSISTTLSSGAQSGAKITVLFGSTVSDQATLTGASAGAGGTVTYTVYSDATCDTVVADAGTKAVTNGAVPASDGVTFPNAGTFYWQAVYSGDADNAPATSACTDEVLTVTTPNLNVTKLVATNGGGFGPTSNAMPGDVLNYKITIGNSGNADANNVPVSDDISAILAHASYNGDCSNSCSFAGNTLTWTIDVAAGGSVTLTFSVTLDDTFPTGTTDLPNVVVVTGPGSNCPEASTDPNCDVLTTVATSRLLIEKSLTGNTGGADPDLGVPAANVGDTLHYKLTYSGAGTLTNAVITDVLPQGLAFVAGTAAGNADFGDGAYDAATRTITWHALHVLPDPAGGSVTYDVKVLSTAPDFAQPLVNLATIDSDETGPDSATASVAVLAPPLELTPPPTSTLTPESAPSNPGFALMLILIGIAGLTLGIGFVTPTPERVRRRSRLG